jgi:hypothetical protein
VESNRSVRSCPKDPAPNTSLFDVCAISGRTSGGDEPNRFHHLNWARTTFFFPGVGDGVLSASWSGDDE